MDKYTYLAIVGDRVRRLREARNMSQDKLAQLCGYGGRSSISLIEKGQRDTPTTTMSIIADVLGVPIDKLISEKPDTPAGFRPLEASDPGELTLMATYRALNAAGKERLLERAGELSELPRYRSPGRAGSGTHALSA